MTLKERGDDIMNRLKDVPKEYYPLIVEITDFSREYQKELSKIRVGQYVAEMIVLYNYIHGLHCNWDESSIPFEVIEKYLNENLKTKQVIVIRNDLNMRKGKIGAQVAHASMAFLTKDSSSIRDRTDRITFCSSPMYRWHAYEIDHWLSKSFKKVVVYVNSEQELEELHQKALDKGLISHIIEDNGATEFHGVKTKTCVAIGPHADEKFVGLTDHLPLL